MEVSPVNGNSPITKIAVAAFVTVTLVLFAPGSSLISHDGSLGRAPGVFALLGPTAKAQETAGGSGRTLSEEPATKDQNVGGDGAEGVNQVTSAKDGKLTTAEGEPVPGERLPEEAMPGLSPEALELLRQTTERGGPYAVLVDLTVCVGCRACVVACKQKNGLPLNQADYVQLAARNQLNNPDPSIAPEQPKLSADTYTVVEYHLVDGPDGEPKWVFVKRQCMHCLEPSCEAACPVGALEKNEEGPVLYDSFKCMGCRYCMMACPFGVPTYEWDTWNPVIKKCTFCFDQILDESLPPTERVPACVRSCPADALLFGNRDVLLKEAHRRIDSNPGKYVDHVYGEFEAGGTSWLYISPVPFEELGFPTNVGVRPYPEYTAPALGSVPLVVVFGSTLLAGLFVGFKRRREGNGNDGGEGGGSSLSSRVKFFIAVVVLGAAVILGLHTIFHTVFTHHAHAALHAGAPAQTVIDRAVR